MLSLSRTFADKPLTIYCYRTIVQQSIVAETKDFLILETVLWNLLASEADIGHELAKCTDSMLAKGRVQW